MIEIKPTQNMIESVERGAQWLDEVRPGWHKQIDLSQLNLASCQLCVAGQVFADQVTPWQPQGTSQRIISPWQPQTTSPRVISGFHYAWSQLDGITDSATVCNYGFASSENDCLIMGHLWDELNAESERTDDGVILAHDMLGSLWVDQVKDRLVNDIAADWPKE